MDLIQDQSTALNVWHIKDSQTIGINWVKGNIPQRLSRKQEITEERIHLSELSRERKLDLT